jgi:CheY-like chemotaxis protein
LLNARDAMPQGGKLTVETANVRIDEEYVDTRYEDIDPGRYVMLAVSDTGHGIGKADLEKIFDPFFTTKGPGHGSGLGLSMIQGFMKQSGGTVRVYSEPGVGTTFKLYFRALTVDQDTIQSEKNKPVQPVSSGARLLLVEDEPGVLDVLTTVLTKAGYEIETATTGDDAYIKFAADPTFDLLLTDIVMPGSRKGTDLAKDLRKAWPHLPVIFMSGYASEATVHGNGLRPEDIRLMKPVRRSELIDAVETALARVSTPA